MKAKVHRREAQHLPHNAEIAIAEVDDPYEPGARITAVRSIRSDVLGQLHSHHQIDDAQFAAGRRWQKLYEKAYSTIKAIDPSLDSVDGKAVDWPTEWQLEALRSLTEANEILKPNIYWLVFDILGCGNTIQAAAAKRGVYHAHGIVKIGVAFRGALETLAIFFGFAQRRKI